MAKESFVFSPGIRDEIKAKLACQGSSGSGKTCGALLLAYGLCGDWRRIAVVDTESDSTKQYCGQTFDGITIPSGDGSFMHCSLGPPYGPDRLIDLVEQVDAASVQDGEVTRSAYDVLVFDSLSHAYDGAGGILELVDKAGAGFAGWKTYGPKLRKLVDALRLCSLHVVATLRTSTEYQIDTTNGADGKQKISGMRKIGTKPRFKEGLDYEFTTVFRLDQDHTATVDKDRTNLFSDRPPSPIGVDVGRTVAQWCSGAACQIGGAEWTALRLAELREYSGSLEGIATLWRGIATHKARIKQSDWPLLWDAKEASKKRLSDTQQEVR